VLLDLYRTVTNLAYVPARLLLSYRAAIGKEDNSRIGERLGQPSLPRPSSQLVWCHGASVGEATSLIPLIKFILSEFNVKVLLTTGSSTSGKLVAGRLPVGAIHQYMPMDRRAWVGSFLDHWTPELVIWVESELWPNMLNEIRRKGLPAVLINGRLSERSFRRWRWARKTVKQLLSTFQLTVSQSLNDGIRFRRLGSDNVIVSENLKFGATNLPVIASELEAMQQQIGTRPVWLAASTHAGEEEIVLDTHCRLSSSIPNLLTIIAPRHPKRGKEIIELATRKNLRISRRSEDNNIGGGEHVHLVDTLGELGLFYSVSPIVFMGKSLTMHGGQNILEPARHHCAIIHGPNMDNFQEIASEMLNKKASLEVADGEELYATTKELLFDAQHQNRLAQRANAYASSRESVTTLTVNLLSPFLKQASGIT